MRKKKREQCPHEHRYDYSAGYLAWHEMASTLMRKGVKQFRCQDCRLYHFPPPAVEAYRKALRREVGA